MNFIQTRTGKYRYEYQVGTVEGNPNARKLIVLEVNYLKASRKGIILTIRPTTIEQHEGYHTESFEMFAGTSRWARLITRKNDKITATVANSLDAAAPQIVQDYIANPERAKEILDAAITQYVPQEVK